MKDKKIEVIKCPVCGMEYLPGEIYMPKHFLGQPKNIVKEDASGEIISYDEDSMDLIETFTCERCCSPFKVTAKVSFSVEALPNFNTEYSTELKKESLFLSED